MECGTALRGDVLQQLLLVAGVSFDGFDQHRHQVVAALQLHVDVAPGVTNLIAAANQTIEQPDRAYDEQDARGVINQVTPFPMQVAGDAVVVGMSAGESR